MRILIMFAAAALAIGLAPQRATASGAGAIALTFNTSARAEGMGGAGVAGVWGGDTDIWANPALLAFRPGARYGTMHSELAAGLAEGITLDKQELTLGWGGFGLLYARAPFDHVYLDMGTQQGTDENGDPTGTFESWEKSRSWGLGAGATQVLDRFAGTDLNRWFDVAAGYVWRDFEDKLAQYPALQDQGAVTGKASAHDWGLLARVTPLNTLEQFPAWADAPIGLVLEGTYGRAKQNATDEFIAHVDVDQTDPMPTAYVAGWAVHAELVPGSGLLAGLPMLVRDAVTPLLAWTYSEQQIEPGYVWDATTGEYRYARDETGRYVEDSRGHEISVLNLFFVRRGHYTYTVGDVDDITTGWGVNVQAGRYGGVRWDTAEVPQAKGLDRVTRTGWHFWVDLAAILGSD